MAKSPDHPELNFVQASGYTRGRPDGPPLWIVVHDMEAGESSTRAESTAAYFASGSGGRSVSSHYCVDDNSVIQCVLLKDVAWTVGNRPGNNRGINWEFSGFARQTREQWLDAFGLAMFAQAAPIIRADAKRFNIPLRRCTIADLKARRPGVTSHNDLRLAFGQTTHTDPGPNFPWDVFMQYLTEGGDDMANVDQKDWEALIWRVHCLINNLPAVADGAAKGQPNKLAAKLAAVEADVEALKTKPIEVAVDQAMLTAALSDPAFLASVAAAINEDAARRLAD